MCITGVRHQAWVARRQAATSRANGGCADRARAGAGATEGAAIPLPPAPPRPDLGSWIRAWIERELAATPRAQTVPRGPLQQAAAASLQEVYGAVPERLMTRLGAWLEEHIAQGLEQGVQQWQWELLLQCWGA